MLGIEPWDRQAEIIRAIAAHSKVAVRSGHKIGKSTSAAGVALWWYQTRPRAKVVLTSSTDDQIRLILWAELRRLVRVARRPIEGALHESHRSGLVAPDGRIVVGIATNQTENMGGFSGAELLFIADEASGIDKAIFEAIEGNRAGGARLLMLGNPTQTSGTFYDAFHDKREFWRTLHVSSEEAVEYQERVRLVPGLATREWVEEKRKDWNGPPRDASPDDKAEWKAAPEWDVRVGGNFPGQSESAVIGLSLVEVAKRRPQVFGAEDRLSVGVDVARYGDDETTVQGRRGNALLPLLALRSLDGPDVAGRVLEYVRMNRREGERPRVKVDVIGVGASVFDVLRRSTEVEAVAVNVAESPTAKPRQGEPGFAKLRDQLWFGLRDWLRDGGALLSDPKLEAELVAPRYGFDAQGRYKVEGKDEMKKRLKRSPDRADALALAVYEPPRFAVSVGGNPFFQ